MITFREHLEMSDMNHRVARDGKRHVLVHMNPTHFLHLTTPDDEEADKIRREARPLSDYNGFVRDGETLNSPFLRVSGGAITGHEGRHRAAALEREGISEMPVHIALRDDVPGVRERDKGWEHVPDSIGGEFGRGTLHKHQMSLVRDRTASL